MTTVHTNGHHRPKSRIHLIRAGKVYDVTNFADRHPGGRQVLEQNNRADVEATMKDSSSHTHSKAAYSMLEKYFVGTVDSFLQSGSYKDVPDTITRLGEYYENDLVDWSKPMVGQVELLGDKYFDWVHEQVDRPIRLFKSDFAEMMTKAYWWMVPITWLPPVLLVLWMSFKSLSETRELWPQHALGFELEQASIPCLFALGVFIWTFLEYAIHRWLFHLRPPSNSPFLIRLHFSLHGQHHKSPMDPMRLVFPPLPASVFAAIFLCGCKAVFPHGAALAVFAGICSGYICYDLIHYYLHHGGHPPVAYFQRLKTYHAHHHYEYQQLGFGISSKMWDYPFGTLIPEDDDMKKS